LLFDFAGFFSGGGELGGVAVTTGVAGAVAATGFSVFVATFFVALFFGVGVKSLVGGGALAGAAETGGGGNAGTESGFAFCFADFFVTGVKSLRGGGVLVGSGETAGLCAPVCAGRRAG